MKQLLNFIAIFCLISQTMSQDFRPFPPAKKLPRSEVHFEKFVGSEVCAECHVDIYNEWKQSTHGMAGGIPSAEKVIGRFDGRKRLYADGSVTPLEEDGDYRFIVEWLGEKREIKVDGVVGKGHMYGGGTQTYFSKFPDGTVRLLPFDFHRGDSVWFSETSTGQGWVPISEEVSMLSLSEWPPSRPLGTIAGVQSCQECHGSQIETQFDYEAKSFQTRFVSLSINCESCHGPGQLHVQITRQDDWREQDDIGMESLSVLAKDEALNVCFQCHALKDQIHTGYLPGKDLEAYYSLKFPMLGQTPYLPDGRVSTFGYQQNHIFSDCYLNGSMACGDCHSPHSLSYRDVNGSALAGRFDDGQCTSCHASKAVNLETHTFHNASSEGSRCTSCHMPYLQHKIVGNRLQYARSDHTVSIPRPQFDHALGIESACSKCHDKMTVLELQETVDRWYGELKPHKQLVKTLMEDILEVKTSLSSDLIGSPEDPPAMTFAALARFFETRLNPDMKNVPVEVMDKLKILTSSADLDVKALALASMHLVKGSDHETRSFLEEQIAELGKNENKVRDRWALALAHLGDLSNPYSENYRSGKRYEDSIIAYRKSLEVDPDDSMTLLMLALRFQSNGDAGKGDQTFKLALQANPKDWIIWVNYGNLLWDQGRRNQAAEAYERSIDINPHYPLGQFNMGNVYYAKRDYPKARHHYEQVVKLDSSIPLAHFYLARTYMRLRMEEKALASVERALVLDPNHKNSMLMQRDLKQILGK